jgi:hypothetical protein
VTITVDYPPLFGLETGWPDIPAPARQQDPVTSHEAAASVNVKGSQVAVLRVLAFFSEGLPDHEIADLIDGFPGTYSEGVTYSDSRVRTARHELELAGHVVDLEDADVWTPRGGRTRRWGITSVGRDYLNAVTR